jgi:hypothetical protein
LIAPLASSDMNSPLGSLGTTSVSRLPKPGVARFQKISGLVLLYVDRKILRTGS